MFTALFNTIFEIVEIGRKWKKISIIYNIFITLTKSTLILM